MRAVVLLNARTLKVAHLCVGRALKLLTVPQRGAFPVAKLSKPPAKGLGKCYV